MKKIKHIILDTSIFVNPDSRHFFGKTTDNALDFFLDKLHQKQEINCYMPPSIWEELSNFLKKEPEAKKSILIKKQPPSSYQTSVPALMVYEFIEEVRARINKGLRIAEKYTRKGTKASSDQEQETIKSLRVEFRTALREGIIDSKEDFDLILLAQELGACIATSDNGLVKWAQKLGIACLTAKELKGIID
ncbi:MAG: RNA ligase partner protein [Candidatus Omnitrophica bacterium]|nr:RNA ligase partner protein [Candidatus Omnitrophota bacterium]